MIPLVFRHILSFLVIGLNKLIVKLEFFEFPVIANQSADWCGNLSDRSTISQSFTGKFREIVQKNSLYDDGLPGIRWRFPHQSEDWFGMTRCSGRAHLCKFQFVSVLIKSDNLIVFLKSSRRDSLIVHCPLSIVNCQLNSNLPYHRTIPSGAGQKRPRISGARLGRPPCGQILICPFAPLAGGVKTSWGLGPGSLSGLIFLLCGKR